MKVIIKIDLDKATDELVVKNRLREWLLDNFLDGGNAEVNIERIEE